MWEGKQLVPAEWYEAATSKQVPNDNEENPDWKQGYGFQFWRGRHNTYRGDGAFGQFCLFFPEYDAVLIVTSATERHAGHPRTPSGITCSRPSKARRSRRSLDPSGWSSRRRVVPRRPAGTDRPTGSPTTTPLG